ncbi:chromosome partitioning protein, ParB family [Noviherbaspirillum humi]|uniref:Chromosome partitioning protein, ParB family n=1 Tax=Noviherbaspirillum humi TaxID=1688639 RepID=A0A239IMY1_9BURK|nr:ParB/RepB/Spo0J family partition protein [Noviherbaspirillum humi]SNS95030.1 chromosome partitioning protein, ParB family [Noviherbaspirillum humi]
MSIYDKLGAKTAGVKARSIEKPAEKSVKTAPAMFLNATQRMDAAEARAEELEKRLKEAEAKASSLEIALSELHEIEGRRRKLTAEEYQELRENLRQNELVTPITVRQRESGGYEIISGHNRVAVFRDLGRESIPAVVRNTDKEQADVNAFYANLLQPHLPDYEKYLGFCMLRSRRGDLSHEELADMAGISRQQVSRLMAFAELPAEAVHLLNEHPAAIGANAAQALAAAAKSGHAQRVVEAVSKVISGELDQARAVKFAGAGEMPTKPAKLEPVRIKVGKAVYCDVRRNDRTIRLDFKSPEMAEAAHDAIRNVLEALAKGMKGGD